MNIRRIREQKIYIFTCGRCVVGKLFFFFFYRNRSSTHNRIIFYITRQINIQSTVLYYPLINIFLFETELL